MVFMVDLLVVLGIVAGIAICALYVFLADRMVSHR